MRPPYWYTLAGVLVLYVLVLCAASNNFTAIRQVGSRYLAGATDVLAVYVNNPNIATPDTTPPTVTLVGSATVTLTVGDTYVEQGATATDNVDTNLTVEIFVDGSASSTSINNTFIDTSVVGTHTVLYKVTDTAGNVGTASRMVVVNGASGGTGGGGGGGSSGGGGGGGGAVVPPTTTPPVIVPQQGGKCSTKGDFNNDGKVNLADFSILAYWYKRPLTPEAVKQCIDLNGDGKITLADFSILAYYWTK